MTPNIKVAQHCTECRSFLSTGCSMRPEQLACIFHAALDQSKDGFLHPVAGQGLPTEDQPGATAGQAAEDVPQDAHRAVDASQPAGVSRNDGGAPTEPSSAAQSAAPPAEAETAMETPPPPSPQPAAEIEPSAAAEEPPEQEATGTRDQEEQEDKEAKPTSLFGRAAAAVAAVGTVRTEGQPEPEATAARDQEQDEAKPTSLFGRAAAAVAAVGTVRTCCVSGSVSCHRAPQAVPPFQRGLAAQCHRFAVAARQHIVERASASRSIGIKGAMLHNDPLLGIRWALQAVGVTGLVDKVLHGDGQAKAQEAAQEASFNDAEAVAFGGVTPKTDKSTIQEPSGDNVLGIMTSNSLTMSLRSTVRGYYSQCMLRSVRCKSGQPVLGEECRLAAWETALPSPYLACRRRCGQGAALQRHGGGRLRWLRSRAS